MSSNKSKNQPRVEELMDDAAYERLVAEEALILEAQMEIQRALNDREMTQADLARKLGVGDSYVSQMLGSSARNLTLRTIARIAHVLGEPVQLVLGSREPEELIGDQAARSVIADEEIMPITNSEPWGEVIELTSRPRRNRGRDRSARCFATHLPRALLAEAA